MVKFHRYFWSVLMTLGVLMCLTLIVFMGIGNPTYVYDDGLVKLSLLITLVGAIGSIINVYARFGLKESSPVLTAWSIAALSLGIAETRDDFSALNWFGVTYLAVIVGSLLVVVYTFRSSK